MDEVRKWKTGNLLDPFNTLGALIERKHMEKVLEYIGTGNHRDGAVRRLQAVRVYGTRQVAVGEYAVYGNEVCEYQNQVITILSILESPESRSYSGSCFSSAVPLKN